MRSVNYYWRLIGTGICFSAFGIGGIVLTLVIFPVMTLGLKSHKSKVNTTRKLVHKSFRLFTWLMSVLGICDYSMAEAEKKLAGQRGKIIIANHPSLIDVVALVSVVPHAVCVVKKELWNNFFLKGVVQASGYIKNDGNVENLMRDCKKSLSEGYSIVIFPEGTRTVPGQSMKLQRGASNIALRCEVDLVPVLVSCKPTTLIKGEHWYNIPPEKIRFCLRADNSMKIKDFLDGDESMAVSARRLTEYIRDYYRRELKQYG